MTGFVVVSIDTQPCSDDSVDACNSRLSDQVEDDHYIQEARVRANAKHNPGWLLLVNAHSTVLVFAFYLISLESLVSIALSVTATLYVHQTASSDFNGSTIDWVLLSFAVITPISASISMAFNRRDQALRGIAVLRATALELYMAQACWDWGFQSDGKGNHISTGRSRSSIDWLAHSDKMLSVILNLFCELTRYLTLPTSSRARHKVTTSGQSEADELLSVSAELYERIMDRFHGITKQCESLKQAGLPPNEATRVRHWERILLEEVENLRMIKRYRTPQGLRSFGRLFSVCLPPFYAPYYAQLANELNSIGVAIAFACLTAIALTSLFNTVSQMEDPFVSPCGLDGINVPQELMSNFSPRIMRLRKNAFPDAQPFEDNGDEEALLVVQSLGPLFGSRILKE
ncbi:hypothetical protein ACA910_000598 [Epithemia clementina (nom. ined.)]